MMNFDERIFLIPKMPSGIHYALRRRFQDESLQGKWIVSEGDFVTEKSELMRYNHLSIKAPFSGRVLMLSYADHLLRDDLWDDWQASSQDRKYPVTDLTLVGIQPVHEAYTQDAVNRAYIEIIEDIRNQINPPKTNIFHHLFDLPRPNSDIVKYKDHILMQLAELSHAKAKIAPLEVNIDEYFSVGE